MNRSATYNMLRSMGLASDDAVHMLAQARTHGTSLEYDGLRVSFDSECYTIEGV